MTRRSHGSGQERSKNAIASYQAADFRDAAAAAAGVQAAGVQGSACRRWSFPATKTAIDIDKMSHRLRRNRQLAGTKAADVISLRSSSRSRPRSSCFLLLRPPATDGPLRNFFQEKRGLAAGLSTMYESTATDEGTQVSTSETKTRQEVGTSLITEMTAAA